MGGKKKTEVLFNEEEIIDGDLGYVNAIDSENESNSEAESEADEVVLTEPSKRAIYNREGLVEKLEDISWPENVEWIDKLTIDLNQDQDIDVNDDIIREMAFYTQALEGTRQAFQKVHSLGLPFFRPPDYYAEMVKTDAHMLKVKGKLLVEKKKIEEADERKKAREAKKIAKEVQAWKLKERAKTKKDEFDSVKKWRKQRQQSGFVGGKDAEIDLGFDSGKGFERSKKRRPGVTAGDRSGGIQRRGGKVLRGQERTKKQREYKDSRFGHGGRKGLKKQNTAETTNDLRGFNKGDFPGNKKRKSF